MIADLVRRALRQPARSYHSPAYKERDPKAPYGRMADGSPVRPGSSDPKRQRRAR